jgi:hypothetical protein
MTMPNFSGDEYNNEINPREWLSMIKKTDLTPFTIFFFLTGENFEWWDSLDKGTKLSPTRENFEKIFSNKWMKDTKMEEMYKIQEDLKEEKEYTKNKRDELSNI